MRNDNSPANGYTQAEGQRAVATVRAYRAAYGDSWLGLLAFTGSGEYAPGRWPAYKAALLDAWHAQGGVR